MKKLMLSLIVALFALSVTDAFARGYYKSGKCYSNRCAEPCVEYATECPTKACRIDRIVESPCPAVPCCVRYVKVEEPALVTKHVSYSVECPSGCTEEQKAAGMMKAGESWQYNNNGDY